MAQILTMEEVAPFITELAGQIKKGVYEAHTKKGVMMRMPDEITIQAIIVAKPQHLAITRTSERTGEETQGGGSNEESATRETGRTDGQNSEDSSSRSEQHSESNENSRSEGTGGGLNTQSATGSTTQDETSSRTATESAKQTTVNSTGETVDSGTTYDYVQKG